MRASEYLERIDHTNQLVECPACGTDAGKFTDISRVDRYGLPARFRLCPACAGVWITPRMNSDEYEKFYSDGTYRRMVWENTGLDAEKSLGAAKNHAINILTAYPDVVRPNTSVVDIGGGDGQLSRILEDNGVKTTIVDPFIDSSLNGETRTIQKCAEQWLHDEKYDMAFCLATLDHLLDPGAVLSEIRNATSRLIVDVIDFPARWKLGHHEACKIDHPSNFCDVTITTLLARTGWEVDKKHGFPANHQIAYLCHSAEPRDLPHQPAKVEQIIRGKLCSRATSPLLSSQPY